MQQIDTGADSALEWTAPRWQDFTKTQGGFTPEFVLHRFVHSGGVFAGPTRIDAAVRANLEGLTSLAPLHTKNALKIVDTVAAAFPLSTGIACFDTTFHETLPQAAFTYAIPSAWREGHGIRKYGFHGFAHDYADTRAREILGQSPVSKVLSCHLGSGASLAAIIDGVSFDTTMGFTPVDGLVMATRPGSVDPGALAWLLVNTSLRPSEMAHLLEHSSGLTGIAGHGDMKLIMTAAGKGDPEAVLAYEVWLHRLVGEMGRMIAVMGGVDLIVFGGGIGNHAWQARSDAVAALGFLNARIDPDTNRTAHEDMLISTHDSAVATVVLEAREDIAMLRSAGAAGALQESQSKEQ
ncbi:acetate/propionate family kinase [Subtercola boreus]|uniref:acetate/propionate family kinase n=1 Tax=Subtercola boreus TaxID=120213 RepID=UPI00155876C2|nr:acetate/propionate family kinase [Subtercola boreus]